MIKVIEFVYFSKCSSPPQAHPHIPLHPSPVCDSTQSPHKRNSISHLSSQNIASHIQPSFPSVAPSTFLLPFYLSTGSFTIRADNFSYLTKQSFQSYLIIKVAHQIIAPEFGSAHSFRLLFFFPALHPFHRNGPTQGQSQQPQTGVGRKDWNHTPCHKLSYWLILRLNLIG